MYFYSESRSWISNHKESFIRFRKSRLHYAPQQFVRPYSGEQVRQRLGIWMRNVSAIRAFILMPDVSYY